MPRPSNPPKQLQPSLQRQPLLQLSISLPITRPQAVQRTPTLLPPFKRGLKRGRQKICRPTYPSTRRTSKHLLRKVAKLRKSSEKNGWKALKSSRLPSRNPKYPCQVKIKPRVRFIS